MNNYTLCILGTCWLFLPFHIAAQTTSVQPGEPRSASTPDAKSEAKTTAKENQDKSELQVELGASFEILSNGNEWQSYFLLINRKFNSGQTLYGSVSVVRRFDLTDQNLMIGLVQPLNKSKRWIATFEASGSPRHQVLPQVSFYGQLERNFGAGWIGRAGLSYRHYSADTVNIGIFGLERYFKQYRAAYTFYLANLNGKGTSGSHLVQGNYYYGERNSIGLSAAFGKEIESVGHGVLIRTDVQELSVNGRQWMNQKWGFSYVLWWHRQGELYTRSGGQIGLLLRF